MQSNAKKIDETNTILELMEKAILDSKETFSEANNSEEILEKLYEMRASAPQKGEALSGKVAWFKNMAQILFDLKIIDPILLSVKGQVPKFWSQLTFKQKVQVSAFLPALSAGVAVGGVGLAGLGSAVGIPAAIVPLVILFLTNGLIEFIDTCINMLGGSVKNNVKYEDLSILFESFFSNTVEEVFKNNYDLGKSERVASFHSTGDKPRDYEYHVVNTLSKEFEGKGYVTPQSRDGGIDGYIVSDKLKEVILIQSKFYTKKVGFGDVTQYLGTLKFWQAEASSEGKFKYPITKIIIACPNGFSIEAKRVSKLFESSLVLRKIKML